jgi:hypothetical protein
MFLYADLYANERGFFVNIVSSNVNIEMGDARWRSGIPDGSISMETKSNRILPRLVTEHEEYRTNRPCPTEL